MDTSTLHHQNRAPSHWVPQSIAGIPKSRHALDFPMDTDFHWQQFSPHTMSGRCTEYYRQNHIGCCSRNQQHPKRDIRVKDTAHHRNAASCQKSYRQDRAGHAAGHSKKQQQHSKEPWLSAVGNQPH